MIETLLKILTVAGLGAVQMFAAVPAGLAMGLPAWVVGCASAAGSIAVLLVVVLLGERARTFLLRRFGPTPEAAGAGAAPQAEAPAQDDAEPRAAATSKGDAAPQGSEVSTGELPPQDVAAPGGGRPPGGGRQYRWAMRIWDRYGVIGLALIAPLFPGAPIAAALTLALGVPARRVFIWLSLGIILWTAGVTLAAVLGFTGFQRLTR